MSNSFAARFSSLDFTNVYGFPNTVPDIKVWEDVLPKFGEYADENPAQHLFEFHKLMDELNAHHEDVLMNLFMFSVERGARLWYKSLPHSSIPSLKDFHTLFHQYCKRIYLAEILFEDCCSIEFIRQKDKTNPLEEEETTKISQVDEGDQHDEELDDKETRYDSSCDHIQEEDIQHHGQPAEEKENNSCLIHKFHRPPPLLIEEEINLLLNSHVATPAYADLQHPHSLEYLVDSVLFHEKKVVVMFNHFEECLVFEDDVKAADDEEDIDIF
jgi:hypothetical protein